MRLLPGTAVMMVVLALACSSMGVVAQTPQAPPPSPGDDRRSDPARRELRQGQVPALGADAAGPLQAVVVLVPGSNGDGRGQVDDPVWQEFATQHHLALVGCRFTDKPHDQNFIEDYVNVSKGSGQALLDALGSFADALESSGARDRAAAAVGHVGGRPVQLRVRRLEARARRRVRREQGRHLLLGAPVRRPRAACPGILFVGGKDLEFRTNTIAGLFAVNRRGGALWALAEEPGAAHIVGRSRDVALVFFEDVLALRLARSAERR